jgi:hypothetical protein
MVAAIACEALPNLPKARKKQSDNRRNRETVPTRDAKHSISPQEWVKTLIIAKEAGDMTPAPALSLPCPAMHEAR